MANVEEEYFCRLQLLSTKGVTPVLVKVLEDIVRSTCNGDVDKFLKVFKNEIQSLKKKKVINEAAYQVLFPQNGKTDINTWDISLLTCILLNFSTLEGRCNKGNLVTLLEQEAKNNGTDIQSFLTINKSRLDQNLKNQLSSIQYDQIYPKSRVTVNITTWDFEVLAIVLSICSTGVRSQHLKDLLKPLIIHEIALSQLNTDLAAFLRKHAALLDNLQVTGIISNQQHELLYPTQATLPDINTWDQWLLVIVVLNVCRCLKCSSIQAIKSLKNFRNEKLAHASSPEIEETIFKTLWKKIVEDIEILIENNVKGYTLQQWNDSISHIRSGPLNKKESVDVLKEWYKERDETNETITETNKKITETREMVKETNDNITGKITKLEEMHLNQEQRDVELKQQINELALNQKKGFKELNDNVQVVSVKRPDIYKSRVEIQCVDIRIVLQGNDYKAVRRAEDLIREAMEGEDDNTKKDSVVRSTLIEIKEVTTIKKEITKEGSIIVCIVEGSIILRVRCHTLMELNYLLHYDGQLKTKVSFDELAVAIGQRVEDTTITISSGITDYSVNALNNEVRSICLENDIELPLLVEDENQQIIEETTDSMTDDDVGKKDDPPQATGPSHTKKFQKYEDVGTTDDPPQDAEPLNTKKNLMESLELKINAIVNEATARLESGQDDFVKRQANQALIAINEAKEAYLQGRSEHITEEKLEHWFGQCAFLLHQIGDTYAATRWFYTATMFPVHWDATEHARVANVLWHILLSKPPDILMQEYEVLSMLLIHLEKLAEKVLRREKWNVCVKITLDLKQVHDTLSKKLGPLLLKFPAKHEKLKQSYIGTLKIAANAHLHLGDNKLEVAKKIAMLLLTQLCEYDDPDAFEIWARALFKTKEFDLAAVKCKLAMKYTKNVENTTRLRELMADIKSNIVVEEYTDVPNLEWLTVTQAAGAKSQETQKSHSRSGNSSICSSVSSLTGTSGFIDTNLSELDSESDNDTSTSDMSYGSRMSTPESEPDTCMEETSFYAQSCYYYSNTGDACLSPLDTENSDGKLLKTGLTLSFNFLRPYNRSVDTVQRQAFYKPFKQEIELKKMMLKRPDIFKRCVIHIEGSHLSNCIPIDTKDKIKMIEISGRSKAGQVFNDDEVVVEVLDTEHDTKDKRFGKVVGILNRHRHKGVPHPVFICTLDDMESHLVRPLCKTVPKLHILNKKIIETSKKIKRYKVEIYSYDEQTGELCNPKLVDVNPSDRQKYVFLVAYILWTPLHIYPIGAVIKTIPCETSIDRSLTILNLQHEVPTLYRRKTVEHVENMTLRYGDEPSDSELDGRKDLTGLETFTIDLPDAKDLDDALSIETTNTGYKVGVHISDVSYYVRQGDPLDEEARERAVTFYPGIRKSRNMLPEPLSSNICSLLPYKVRLTKSVVFDLDSRGKPTQLEGQNFEISESFIQSRKQLSYGEAQNIINDANSSHPLATSIKTMFKLAHAIRKDRLGNSMFAFDLENDENISEDGSSETREAHYLVEEFMIMANRKVAQVLKRRFPNCVSLRCQPPPSKERMEYFVEKHGYYIDILVRLQDKQISDFKKPNFEIVLKESSDKNVLIVKRLWDIITQSSDQDAEYATKIIMTDDLHPLQHLVYQHWLSIQEQALYRCSGSTLDSEDGKHYSLNYSPYTHFTSPIRRYNDIVIHRLLHACITGKRSTYDKSDIDTICIDLNDAMKRSKDYQKGCRALQQAIHFQEKPQMINCYVDEVSDSGVNLCSPILLNVAKPHMELSFNRLDINIKPDVITDTFMSQEKVKATCRKRLYDNKGMSTNPADRGNEHTINAKQGIVSIPIQQWAKILNCAIDGRLGDLESIIKHTDVSFPGHGTDDVSTERILPSSIQPKTKFSMTFTHGQIVKVQMSAEAQKGILTPMPVLYSMTNNVQFCLQHTGDPVLHLSQYATRPTCDQYKSSMMYAERWLPLINMEAATGAVKNEASFIINNVHIKFSGGNEGKFALPLDYCEKRNIEFSGTTSEDDDDDDNEWTGTSYDWLCIKCVIPSETSQEQTSFVHETVWVAHAEVNKVEKKKDNVKPGFSIVVVSFSLHHRSPNVPVDTKANTSSEFSVEVLTKSEVDRRTECCIRQLAGSGRTIAVTIALNDAPIPKLDKDHAYIANLIERDLKFVPSDEITFPVPANNKSQQEAIDKALGSRFSLIQGPPGTGKTYTGIKLIYLFNKINRMLSKKGKLKKQVLFCGPSNKSVDLVARWMLLRMGKLCPKIVRVYGRSIEAMEFPIPGKTFLSKRSTRNQTADKLLEPVTLHHLIRQNGNRFAEDINAFDTIFKDSGYAPQPDNVRKYKHLVREASIEEIRKYDVIICTTAVGSNPEVLKATSVHQVIIDGSGMCLESQCLVPIIATKAEQVVLIGDHKQLRPIVMCKEAAELGMEKSLFERYAKSKSARNVQFTMLDIQYRMNPALCCFPSHQFYEGKLKTGGGRWREGDLDIWPYDRKGTYPHVLVHVEGEEKFFTCSTEDGNEQSRSNSAEIKHVIKVFRHLIDEGVAVESINIMSQYNAQCSEIKRELTAQGFSNFNVSTIVSSQGGEWDYIVFSLVRSLPQYKIEKSPTMGWCKQNLGFITDRNQINVALTRARKGLIMIGNINLLKCDIVWKKLIKHYEDRGCIKTTAEFPPPPKTRQQKMQVASRLGDEKYVAGAGTSYEGSFDDVNSG